MLRCVYKQPKVKKTLIQVRDLTYYFSQNSIPKVPGMKKDCIHIQHCIMWVIDYIATQIFFCP
jgi:hypothetical protein